jgi:hypothetical protein
LPFDFEIFWPRLVEEELVGHQLRRRLAHRPAELHAELGRRDQVLAVHLVIDAEGGPAHRPVGLPLQLDVAAGDRELDALAVRLLVDDRALRDVALQRRHLQDVPVFGLTGRKGE